MENGGSSKIFLKLAVFLAVTTGLVLSKELSIVWNDKLQSYGLEKGVANSYISLASFKNDINSTGWAYLEIKTNSSHNDIDQAYTAGLAEGFLTSDLIKMHWYNTEMDRYCTKPLSGYCQRLQDYLDVNAAWMLDQIAAKAQTDPYWHQVRLFLVQLQGLVDGYKFHQSDRASLGKPIYVPDVSGLLMLQISGDLEDLESALHKEDMKHVIGTGSCSALIKLLPGNHDLFVSQDTWNSYGSMLRILKKYAFGFHLTPGSSQVIPGEQMTFSSYPGIMMSGDDFYDISSGLVTLETTIGNGNASRWQFIHPKNSVLEGIRNMVANRLASSGKQWVDYFSQFNSGTYNNQWMVVDYKKFTSGSSSLNDGLLYVLEQIPGMIMSADRTDILRKQSYWPSYNCPSFPEIFNASGGQEMVAKFGDWFSYENTPRAKIFRRDHSRVKDVESMTRLMRYNDFTHDPLSACNCTPPYSAENAISARCDLNPINGTYPFGALGHRSHGGTDMKMTSSKMVRDLEFVAISGPTYDSVPPFQWSKSDYETTVRHRGQPDLWLFKPVQHQWKL